MINFCILSCRNRKCYAQNKIASNKDNGDKTLTVTLDKSLNVPAGAKFSDLLRCGQGSKILRCRIAGTRSRGILLKGDNGLIKDNVFDNCGMAAVSLGPEFYWNEANYTQNIIITGNTFIHNGNTGGGGGVIFIHGEGALGNKNIVIRNNHMEVTIKTAGCMDIDGENVWIGTTTGLYKYSITMKSVVKSIIQNPESLPLIMLHAFRLINRNVYG